MWNSPNFCACIVWLPNEKRVFSAIYKTFQKWKINITSMWPENIYLVMWLTDQPSDWLTNQPTNGPTNRLTDWPMDRWTDWPTDGPTNWTTDWMTDRLTYCKWKRGKSLTILIIKIWIILFAHTIIKRTDRASFLLVWSYTASRMAFSTHFLTLHFLISTTVCIYGLISIGLAFVVSRLGMILQVCTGTAPFS